jgi:hypothetical protein
VVAGVRRPLPHRPPGAAVAAPRRPSRAHAGRRGAVSSGQRRGCTRRCAGQARACRPATAHRNRRL